MSSQSRLTLWLSPCAQDAVRFQTVINALARAQAAPRFPPHITLASFECTLPDLEPACDLLRNLKLNPLEIDGSDVFTQSCFVRVAATPALLNARYYLEACPGFRSGRAFDPHLSLCYGPPPERESDDSQFDDLLAQPIRFDQLSIVEIKVPVQSYDDIRAWRVVDTIPL